MRENFYQAVIIFLLLVDAFALWMLFILVRTFRERIIDAVPAWFKERW